MLGNVIGGRGIAFRGGAATGRLHVEIGNAAGRTAAVAGPIIVITLGIALHDGSLLLGGRWIIFNDVIPVRYDGAE